MAQSKTVTLQKKIDRLTSERDAARAVGDSLAAQLGCTQARFSYLDHELEQLHALLDQQPTAPPRESVVNGVTFAPNLTARMMGWLANR